MTKRGVRNNLVDQVVKRAKEPKQACQVELISSGCDILDLALGGGFPLGCVINLVGDTGSGKTLLATEFLVKAINRYKDRCKYLYDDVESRYSFNTHHIYNTILNPENFRSSRTVEDFNYNFTKFIKTIEPGQFGIYITDCLDMMSSKASMKRSEAEFKAMDSGKVFDEGTYGLEKQKYLSVDFFAKKVAEAKEKNCLLIIISQVRHKIGGIQYGRKWTRAGGQALLHQAYQIIWLSEIERHMKGDRKSGVSIKADIEKNNLGSFAVKCWFEDIINYGIDNIGSNLNYLFDLITDTGKRRGLTSVEWDDQVFKTRRKLISHIEENNQEDQLREAVKVKWEAEDTKADQSKDRKRKY